MSGARKSSRPEKAYEQSAFPHRHARVAYGASQLPFIAWYVGHGLIMHRLAGEARRRDGGIARKRSHTKAPVPDRGRLYADMAVLLWQDLANVEAGLYPLPDDHDGSFLTLLHRSRLFFEDLPEIYQRRKSGAHREVLNEKTAGKRPRYYLQNFQLQSGGRMTDESARRYDTQVEALFNGRPMPRDGKPYRAFECIARRGVRCEDNDFGKRRVGEFRIIGKEESRRALVAVSRRTPKRTAASTVGG